MGVTYSQTIVLSNTGSADVTIDQAAASGPGFSVTGLPQPVTLASGQSTAIAVTYQAPPSTSSSSGSVTVASNAPGGITTVGVSATVAGATVQLSANPTSVNFGSTGVGVGTTQNVALTNTGNSTISISSVSAVGTGFNASGGSNVTLAPNQSVEADVSFDPASPGAATGTLVVTSNAPQIQVELSGNGSAPVQHLVNLSWNPSTSTVVGYYVYRGLGANAQVSKLNGTIVQSLGYQDTGVSAGQTYTYAVTAVDANNVESILSSTVSVTVPSP